MARKSFGMSGSVKATLGGGGYRPASPAVMTPEAVLREAWRLFRSGGLDDAERLCRQFLAQRPDDAEGLNLLGVIALRTGRLPDAAKLLDEALARAPRNPDFLVNRGSVYMAAGQADEGIACFRRALDAHSGHGNAHMNLGLALMGAGRAEDGIPHLREAARLMPKYAPAHSNLGAAVAEHEGVAASLRHLRKAVELAPNDPFVHENLGTALYQTDDPEAALAEYETAAALAPGAASVHFGRARALEKLDLDRRAVAAYLQAIQLDDRLAPAHNNLGLLLAKRDRHDLAVVHLRKAAVLWPEERELRFNLAKTLASAGNFDEAEAIFATLEQEAPESVEPYLAHVSALQQDGRFERAREILDSLRQKGVDPGGYLHLLTTDRKMEVREDELEKVAAIIREGTAPDETLGRLCFAMGSVMERRKAYDEAFEYFRRGNKFRNAKYAYDPAEQHDRIERLMRTFDEAFFAAHGDDGLADDRPVFVVGMMRSGTSLVEQIIASHHLASGSGELEDFQMLARELPEILNSPTDFPECVRGLNRDSIRQLAQTYMTRLSSGHPVARRITDKMPANFLQLGLIALLFPRARIIHCVRDPMDTCLSIYFLEFGGRHEYAYDMERLGHFYGEYRRLMDHWHRVLPVPILDVHYEDLVADTEGQTRRMLDFLGLDWDDNCLRFHETRRSVQTASNWQVRQPVYSTSVARWRRFERHLGPLIEALKASQPSDPAPADNSAAP